MGRGTRVEELYRELGPALYARARRVLQDEPLAERVTMEVIAELARLKAVPRAELVKLAREAIKRRCEQHSNVVFDSLVPGPGRKRKR